MLNRETSLRYFTSRYVFIIYVVENMRIHNDLLLHLYATWFSLTCMGWNFKSS